MWSHVLTMLRAVAVFAISLPLHAHHSFPAHYFADSMIDIQGVVVDFLWRNPHSFIVVDVTDDAGEMVRWSVEWNNTIMMMRGGLSPDSIQPGDEVEISGNLSRDGAPRLRLVTLERPADGFFVNRAGGISD